MFLSKLNRSVRSNRRWGRTGEGKGKHHFRESSEKSSSG